MEVYNLVTVIICLTALFGYINYKYIKLPATIGTMIISIVASLVVIGVGNFNPFFFKTTIDLIRKIDFHTALMKVMLSFLLFAGAYRLI